jgi:hypothetical protein
MRRSGTRASGLPQEMRASLSDHAELLRPLNRCHGVRS